MNDAASTPDRWVCVGCSVALDGPRAGTEAAAAAQVDRPAKLLIVFSSIHFDTADVLEGICSVTPDDVLVIGGTSPRRVRRKLPRESVQRCPGMVLRVADCSNSGLRPVLWLRSQKTHWRACCALATSRAAIPSGGVRCLVLDTVNTNGGPDGSLDETQLDWLTSLLDANSTVRLRSDGVRGRTGGKYHLIMIFSHHTLETMDNATTGTKAPGKRILGDKVQQLLLQHPNVIAWVNGHTHVNNIVAHRRPSGWQAPGGFWEINTDSHCDFPEQSRMVELVDNRDGTLSVFGTIIDSLAPLKWTWTDNPVQLAALSRELARNDWLARVPHLDADGHDGRRGAVSGRNVELLVHTPFTMHHSTTSTEPRRTPLCQFALEIRLP